MNETLMLLYLTHRNVPEKYQYKDDEVVSNFDLKQAIEEDQKNHSLVLTTEDS